MKKVDKNVKYCPECGVQNDIKNRYCIKCGHDFYNKKKKKLRLSQILIIIIILLIMWAIIRIYVNKPIIPEWMNSLLGVDDTKIPKLTIFQETNKSNNSFLKNTNLSERGNI